MGTRPGLRRRCGGRAWLAGALLAWVLGACAETRAPLSALLVTLDTTRADALSCYGGRGGTTPNLDRIAAEGVLYERAFTSAPITLPAHASMLTGLAPIRHGLRDNGIAALDAAARTLPEAAREAGIQTAAFVGAVVLDRAFGLDQGFELYDGPPSARRGDGHIGERPARAVIDAALAWLARRDRGRPFFLWIHLYDAHHPYEPRTPPPAARSSDLERYLAEVHELDAELGRLFAHLEAEELLASTLLAVTADHGEAFGEHQELTHGPFCWNTTLHVPLLLRFPDGRRRGERSRELVGVVDLAPTLAEALRVELSGPGELDGRSLFDARVPDERGLYFESYTGYLSQGWSPLAGWMDAGGKYLHSSRPEFFELASDPGEERDLAPERGPALETYRAAIAAVASRPTLDAVRGAIAEDLREDIQALGYATLDASGDGGGYPHPLAPSALPSPHDMVGPWRQSMGAQKLLDDERFAEAEALYRRLLEQNPANGFLRTQFSTSLMRQRKYEEALAVLLPLLEAPVVQAHAHYKIGICQQRLGRRDEALASLTRAVELAPTEARYREKLEEVRERAPDSGSGEDEE